MERSIKILILIFLYLLFSSRSCDDDPAEQNWQQQQAELVKDSIRAAFQTENLSEQALRVAESNAIRKLEDLADYIDIFSDVSMDSAFRKKAGEMIRNQFNDENARLTFGHNKRKNVNHISLGNFLDSGFGENLMKVHIEFDSVFVRESLQKSGNETYSGKISANQTIVEFLGTDSLISPSLPITIEFTSSKKIKIIGQDTLLVWELKLGNME